MKKFQTIAIYLFPTLYLTSWYIQVDGEVINFNCKTKNRQTQIEGQGRQIQIWSRGRQIQIDAGGRETQIP